MNQKYLFKNIVLVGFVGFVVIFTGCGKQKDGQTYESNLNDKSISEKVTQKKNDVVVSIREALQSGKIMKCTAATDEINGTTYVQGKNIKSIVKTGDVTMNVLVKDGDTYVWQDGNTQGQKTTRKCMEELDKIFGDSNNMINTEQLDEEEIIQKTEDGLLHCQPVSDIKFEIPKEIKFVDQCEAMKELDKTVKQQINQMKNVMPDQVDIKKMQEKIPTKIQNMPN